MLKIKDKLYKYSFMAGFMIYEVFEVRQQENNVLYAIRCLSCKDHDNCELLVVKPKEKKRQEYYEYVCMLNNNEEDEKEQYYWHDTCDKHFYWESKKVAMEKEYRALITKYEKEISDLESSIKIKKDEIKKIEVLIESLTEKVDE